MDFDLSLNLPKEDFLGALKTIYLFLDAINFKSASDALRNECVLKGYDKFDVDPKNIIVNPSLESSNLSYSDKISQTDDLDDEDKLSQLQSSIHIEIETKTSYLKKNFKAPVLDMKPNQSFSKSKSDSSLNTSSLVDDKKPCGALIKDMFGCDNLRQKMRLLEDDYKKLMVVTTELTAALQTHVMGQSENLNAMLNKCRRIYPELFEKSKSVSDEIVCTNSDCPLKLLNHANIKDQFENVKELPDEIVEKVEDLARKEDDESSCEVVDCTGEDSKNIIVANEKEQQVEESSFCHNKNFDLSSDTTMLFELDYKKLKADMVAGDCELQIAIVGALRQKIIKGSKDARNSIMNSYAKNDLLNILPSPNTSNKKNIAETMFASDCKDAHKLREETSRLVNTIASLRFGREYLCKSEDFLNTFLIPVLNGTYQPKVELNPITEDMLIATVQKLSMKYPQRKCMINAEFTEWLVKFLSTKFLSVSRYCLEYATALLMNLCLHRSARERLQPMAKEVLELLGKLLNTKYEFCMQYVNGAIYSLLSDERINQEAHRQNFFDSIRNHIQQTDGEIRSELEHIIKVRLENGKEAACVCDSAIEPEFEVDILEPELDENNLIMQEDILLKYRQSFSNSRTFKCLGRPATPLQRTRDPNKKTKKFPKMSYNEETMQVYYMPTKNGIFNPQGTRKIEPSLFSRKNNVSCSPNCFCNFTVGKTTPYVPDNSANRTLPVTYHMPMCYRNNYDQFKTLCNSKESNRYICNCLQLVSQDVEIDLKNKPSQTDNKVKRYHFCPKCQNHHQLDESNIEMCNRKYVVKGGVVNFSFKELADASGESQPCTSVEEAPCYDKVFQSRPRILRTPP